jgi:hypothetical protein
LFSQTRDGRISSTDPDLFADDGLERLCDCIGGAMKKATNPLALDLRAGGFEVFPIAKLFKLGAHKLRVLWQLAACGTPALGANLFHCPHCQHRHWAPRSNVIPRQRLNGTSLLWGDDRAIYATFVSGPDDTLRLSWDHQAATRREFSSTDQ